MCSVTFTCLGCNEATTLELKGEQYERFASGATLFAQASFVRPSKVKPIKQYRHVVQFEHNDQTIQLDCRLERKEDIKLEDLMLKFLGGLMYEATELQLEGELKRIAGEFVDRPQAELIQFVIGFGLELEGMPYRARVVRVRRKK